MVKKEVSSPTRASPMIREIEIENFRGIEKLQVSFAGINGKPSRTVVVAGPNGCGKTTVLEACLLAAGQQYLVCGPVGSEAIRKGAKEYRITATFQDATGEHRQVVSSAGRKPSSFVVACDYFPSWRSPELVGPLGITAGRQGERSDETDRNRLVAIKQYLIDAKALKSMLPESPNAASSSYDEVMGRINDLWQMFHPGTVEFFSAEPVGTDPREGFDVFLHSEGESRISVDALSSGQLELFCFAGSILATRESQLTSIVCIDEPELHLDPQWHRLVARALMKMRPHCQFILGTHSPELYDSVMSYERHFLVPAEDPRSRVWEATIDREGGA